MIHYFSKGRKETKAARFLVDERPLTEKEPAFRKSLKDSEGWFAELVVGEHLLKDGNREAAHEAFRRGYALVQGLIEAGTLGADRLSAVRLAARLQQLDEGGSEPVGTEHEEGMDRDGQNEPAAKTE